MASFQNQKYCCDKTLHLGRGCTGHRQRGKNLLKMKMLVVHETELYSQSPVTLNKLNIQMPERKDVTLLRDSVTGKAGFRQASVLISP